MLDNSQFRKKKKEIDYDFIIPYMIYIILAFCLGFVFTNVAYGINLGHITTNNGLMKQSDCKVNIQPQPIIQCSNYIIEDNYYYCNIDDVKVVK